MNLPEGWPTEEMVEAVEKIEPNHHSRGAYLRDILITAIDAAPTPPAQVDKTANVQRTQVDKSANLQDQPAQEVSTEQENFLLKAENERLRAGAEEFIEYFNPGADADRSPEQIVAFLQAYEKRLRAAMKDFQLTKRRKGDRLDQA